MYRILAIVEICLALVACSPSAKHQAGNPISNDAREQAMQHADLVELKATLEGIRQWHESANSGIELNSALDQAQFEQLLKAFPCEIPLELREMWKWRNGERTDYFIWYHGFLSIEKSISEYRQLRFNPLFGWKKTWIPVFQFQDEWYFVECANNAVAAAPVALYFTEDEPRYAYLNLTRYLKTMLNAMQAQVLTWGDAWWGNVDVKSLAGIHRELNGSAPFPYAQD